MTTLNYYMVCISLLFKYQGTQTCVVICVVYQFFKFQLPLYTFRAAILLAQVIIHGSHVSLWMIDWLSQVLFNVLTKTILVQLAMSLKEQQMLVWCLPGLGMLWHKRKYK